MWRELVCDLVRLVVGWWRVDQVRISPDEGRLLRLQPPCFVVVAGRPAELLSRTVGHDAGGIFVAYECRSTHSVHRLQVRVVDRHAASAILWTTDGVERLLGPDEVETFVPDRGRRFASNVSAAMCGSTEVGKIS